MVLKDGPKGALFSMHTLLSSQAYEHDENEIDLGDSDLKLQCKSNGSGVIGLLLALLLEREKQYTLWNNRLLRKK